MVLTIGAYLNLPLPLKPLVVKTGSMSPTIPAGSLVLVTETNNSPYGISYVEDDVITFRSGKELVSHRVVGVERATGEKRFVTKGDANQNIDTKLISEKEVVGKVSLAIPYVGKFVDFVKTPLGFFLLIIIPTLFIILSEIVAVWEELRKNRSSDGGNLDFAKPLAMFFMAAVFMGSSHAFFSDVATSTNNVFSAAEHFTSTVVISEVQIDGGTGQANNNDFVELYNPTSIPFNLNGHRLVLRTGSSTNDTNIFIFNSSHVVPARGFFLWAHKSQSNNFADTISANVFSADTLGANNSVALRQGNLNTGTIIDALSWNNSVNSLKEGTHFSPDPGINQSMERKALSISTATTMTTTDALKGNGFDSNNNSTDFVLRLVSQPQNSSSTTESP